MESGFLKQVEQQFVIQRRVRHNIRGFNRDDPLSISGFQNRVLRQVQYIGLFDLPGVDYCDLDRVFTEQGLQGSVILDVDRFYGTVGIKMLRMTGKSKQDGAYQNRDLFYSNGRFNGWINVTQGKPCCVYF